MSKQCDLLLDYFNDQLTKEQQEEFELHLLECEDCQAELAELQQLTEDLPYSSDPIEPPKDMKKRVLANIVKDNSDSESKENVVPIPEKWNEPTKKHAGWYKPLIAAVLTISLIGNGAALVYITNEDPGSESTTKPEGEISIDTIENMQSLQPSEGINAQATAVMFEQNENTNLVVKANDLPQLKGEETYQVWVLENGKPYRAGTFLSNQDGTGGVSYVIKYEGEHTWDTIAITKEPDANSKKPKGEILLSSPL